MNRAPRIGVAIVAALVALLAATWAGAQPGLAAYDVERTEWNGLSSLAVLAESRGARLEQVDELSLATIDADAVLWIVYPTGAIDPEAIAHFVEAGGRLFVADDFGTGAMLGGPFQLGRLGAPAHGPTFEGRPNLPALGPVGEHVLSDDVQLLVTNHPASLQHTGVPVFRFDDGSGLVYDLNLGAGRAIFLADPSLLTNLMLPIRDNARFVANVIDELCVGRDPCRIQLVTEGAQVRGRMQDVPEVGSRARDLRTLLDRWAEELRSFEPPPATRRALEVFLLVASVIVLTSVFPFLAPTWIGRPRRAVEALAPATDLEQAVRRFRGERGVSYAAPIVLMKHDFERRFYAGLGLQRPPAGPGGRTARRAAASRWAERFARGRPRDVAAVHAVLERIAALPDRPSHAPPGMRLDLRAFRRYHEDARRLLAPLDRDSADERTDLAS